MSSSSDPRLVKGTGEPRPNDRCQDCGHERQMHGDNGCLYEQRYAGNFCPCSRHEDSITTPPQPPAPASAATVLRFRCGCSWGGPGVAPTECSAHGEPVEKYYSQPVAAAAAAGEVAERLKEIAEREKAASLGPWYVMPGNTVRPEDPCHYCIPIQGAGGDNPAHCYGKQHRRPNADFISNARADIPWLLAHIAALTAEDERLKSKQQDEVYLRGNQLAAISSILMADTPVSLAATRIPSDHKLYTAAFQDALRTVEKVIALRADRNRLATDLAAAQQERDVARSDMRQLMRERDGSRQEVERLRDQLRGVTKMVEDDNATT